MTGTSTRRGRQRVVVTGMGTVSPLGLDVASTWQALTQGRSGAAPITAFDTTNFPTRIAAAVKGFEPTRFMNPREARRLSSFVHFALAAATEAIAQARLDMRREDPYRVGAEIGSAMGGASLVEEQRLVLENEGVRHLNPTLIPAILINAAPCVMALQMGFKGPVNAAASACATGTISIGEASRKLATGEADVMLAGATEAVLTPLAVAGFSRLGALSTKNDTPEKACAPFDAGRDGTILGEGASVLVLETLEHALRRDAPILAEVLGYCLTVDAYHLVAPDPSGNSAAHAMAGALREGEVLPAELDWICAHGTGTKINDCVETMAIKSVLGERAYQVPVSSNKAAVGHMVGAAGAISTVFAVQAMHTDCIPPTINYETPDPECDLDYVPNVARSTTVRTVLVNCFGFGGQNGCLAVRKWDGR